MTETPATNPVGASLVRDLPAVPAALARLRAELRDLLERCGIDPQRVEEIVLGVHEAAMNAAVHAYPPDEAGRMAVTVEVTDEYVAATIRDTGSWRSPSADGRGLTIMAGLAAALEVHSGEGGTDVRLRFDR